MSETGVTLHRQESMRGPYPEGLAKRRTNHYQLSIYVCMYMALSYSISNHKGDCPIGQTRGQHLSTTTTHIVLDLLSPLSSPSLLSSTSLFKTLVLRALPTHPFSSACLVRQLPFKTQYNSVAVISSLFDSMAAEGNEIPTRRSRSRRSTSSMKVGSLGRCSKQYLKEQRGRLYIMWRCSVMLLCWHD